MISLRHSIIALSIAFCLVIGSVPAVMAGDSVWLPINPADLAMKEPKVEKDADAEALFWEVRIDDSSSEELEMLHYVRVKIFTERGRERFSKMDIPFIKGKKVKDVMARVIKPDGSIVELKKEEIFEREIIRAGGVKVKAKSFAVPNIEPGVIVEYRYREIMEDAGAVGMRLTFQRDIPIQNLSYYYKPYRDKAPDYQSFNMSGTEFVKDKKGFYLATRTNVPSFKEEPRMPPEDQVRPWMLLQAARLSFTSASEFSFSFVIKDPSSPGNYWGAVSTERAGLAKLLNKPEGDVKKAAAEIAGSASTPEEKLKKIYDFCQTKIKNTTYDFSLTDEQRKKLPKFKSIADVLKRQSGNAFEVNLLFGSLAAGLGYETRMAYAGNRSEMFFDPKMTNESFIHAAAIAVNVGNDWKFFDPATPYLPYGMLQWHDEDVWALLVGEKQYVWIKTPFSGVDKSLAKRSGKFKLLEDGTLEGDVEIAYSGQLDLTRKLQSIDDTPAQREESFKEEIKRRIANAELSNITLENVTEYGKPFTYKFKVKVPNYAQKTGKRLFFQPNFFEYNSQPVFQTAERRNEVYFSHAWSEADDIEIEFPTGYTLESGEAPGAVSDPDKISSDVVNMKIKDGRTLFYNRKFHFGGGNNILFPVQAYGALKNLFDNFHKTDTHSLALKQGAATATAAPAPKTN